MHTSSQYEFRLAVTTAVNDTPDLDDKAQTLAIDLNARYIKRDERPLRALFEETKAERILIVQRDKLVLEERSGLQYQFHPNMAIVRAANYSRHGSDHFLEALRLCSGEKVLDCTLGFGCEALLAAVAVGGSGEVVGLESEPDLAVVTRDGMQRYKLQQKNLEAVMRKVVVLNFDYRDYLKLAPSRSFDVVYFDPFFERSIDGSKGTIFPLAVFGNRSPLDVNSVLEARRVAKRIVAIKHVKWRKLPDVIESQVSERICGRRSTVAYSIITGFGSWPISHQTATEEKLPNA
jgi:16S rRNA (guanine1516-N2)-methyltransferase